MPIQTSKHKNAIIAHKRALMRQSIDVPEWGMTIHYDPVTPRQRDALDALDCGENEMLLEAMVKHAKEADGSPCFTPRDISWLHEDAATAIIRRVALRVLTADLVDVNSLGKPSAPTKEPETTPSTPSQKN